MKKKIWIEFDAVENNIFNIGSFELDMNVIKYCLIMEKRI